MSDKSMEVQSERLINSPLCDILSGFREVLNKYGTPDSTVIEFTFIDHKSEQEGAMVVPKGCKHKCWYNKATNSTQCGIVCSV
jgi:hypothetical protein